MYVCGSHDDGRESGRAARGDTDKFLNYACRILWLSGRSAAIVGNNQSNKIPIRLSAHLNGLRQDVEQQKSQLWHSSVKAVKHPFLTLTDLYLAMRHHADNIFC